MLEQKIEIELTGKTEADLEDALEEALRRIRDGNVVGSDSNDDGSFYFRSETSGEPDPDTDDEDYDDMDEDDVPTMR